MTRHDSCGTWRPKLESNLLSHGLIQAPIHVGWPSGSQAQTHWPHNPSGNGKPGLSFQTSKQNVFKRLSVPEHLPSLNQGLRLELHAQTRFPRPNWAFTPKPFYIRICYVNVSGLCRSRKLSQRTVGSQVSPKPSLSTRKFTFWW